MRIQLSLILILISTSLLAQKYDAEIINFDTSVDYNGRNIKTTYEYEIKINNGAGTKYAEIEIFYQQGNEPNNLAAGIYDVLGNKIRSLKKKELINTSVWDDAGFHTDHRLQKFDLIHNQFPYIIKYSYTTTINDYISIANWRPLGDPNILTKKSRLIVHIPTGTPINIFQHKIDSAKFVTQDNIDSYTWELTDFVTDKPESFAPHTHDIIPFVEVMPNKFRYGITGNGDSWKDFGNWKYKLINGLDKLTLEEIKKAHLITDSISDTKEKIKALYHYLQDNTRYILVSLDTGGLVPHPASYVCENRFGDCKALSNYMKALLKEINIESYYTTIYSGIKPDKVNPHFPSHQSNHIILCVPVKKDTIWLECTDKTAPFNYLGSYTQNRLSLVVKENESKLVKTPSHNMTNTIESYVTKISFTEDNDARFSSTAFIQGREFDHLKSFNTQLSNKDKEQYIDALGIIDKTDIEQFNIHRTNRDSAHIILNLNGTAHALTEKLGQQILLKPFKSIIYKMNKPEARKNDLNIYYPINKCDTIIYAFEKNLLEVKGLSESEIKTRFGTYTRSYKIEDNKLYVFRSFQVFQGYYPAKDYKDFYNFINEAVNLDNKKTLIKM